MTMHAAMLPDGKRLHLQHGPIDLIIEAFGSGADVRRAYMTACSRFDGLLDQLVEELPILRSEMPKAGLALAGPVALRMNRAVQPLWQHQVTPMASVAGSVADEILSCMCAAADLDKTYVNNGGDIALHLAHGQTFSIASTNGPVTISAEDNIKGIATSGWRGRSHSLGIADSVTVLAHSAAAADVAATIIANHVDLPGNGKITRQSAVSLSPDSDLGERLVTVDVAPLTNGETAQALDNGTAVAHDLLEAQLIKAATLGLNKVVRVVSAEDRLQQKDTMKVRSYG